MTANAKTLIAMVLVLTTVTLLGVGCEVETSTSEPGRTPTETGEPEAVGNIFWERDPQLAFSWARQENKPVLVDVYADWCGPCRKLDSDTWPAEEVRAYANDFVWLKIDADRQKSFANEHRVTALPTLIVMDAEGKELAREVGFKSPAAMATFLRAGLAKAGAGR